MKHTHGQQTWFRLLAALFGLALVAAACGSDDTAEPGGDDGGDDTTTTTEEEPDRTPTKGGELVFGVEADVANLDAGFAAQPTDKVITLGVFDPLMTYEDGQLVPYLAEDVVISDDLSTYAVTLQPDITFHDGTPLNADAVLQHFNRMKDEAIGCPCGGTARNAETIDLPDGPDGLTVTFHLATPSVAFGNDLAGSLGYIPSPTAVAELGENFKNRPVGTGPFRLTEYSPGERVVLEAYADYWGVDENGIQLPYLDKLTIVPIPDSGQRLSALQAGNIDIFQSADSKTVFQGEEAGFEAQKISGSSSTIVIFNTAKPPFDDVKARQAVAYAIDKDILNDRVYDGIRTPSYSGYAPDSPYFNEEFQTPQHDPDKARELVEELDGLEFTLVCIPTPEADQILQLVKQMGEAVGMSITLETQEQGTYVERIFSKGGDFEAACFRSSHFIDPDALRPGHTTDDPGNLSFYSNPEVDQLFEEARSVGDFEERKAKYDQLQGILSEDMPYLTTLYDLFGNVYDPDKVGPPPPGEANSLGAIKPGLLYAVNG